MYLTSSLDFLPLSRFIRLLIVWCLPISISLSAALWLGWLDWESYRLVVISWPGLLAVLATIGLLRADLPQLIKTNQYMLPLVGFYLNRTIWVVGVSILCFLLTPQLPIPWSYVFAYGLTLVVVCGIGSIALVEIGMSKRLRRRPSNLAIAAITDSSVAFARSLPSQRFVNIRFVGFFEDRDPTRLPEYSDLPVLGRLDGIDSYLSQHALDHIIVSLPTQASFRFGLVLDQVLNSTCSVHYLHDFLLFKPIREATTAVGNLSLFTIIDAPDGGLDQTIKRCLDITGSLFALLLLSPLLLFIALWIKLDSKGNVLFSQNRWGSEAQPFRIYKFRSMTQATSQQAASGEALVQTTKNDQRVTRVGAFIRRTSIDELPQLLNILKGDMSFVGPRPHASGHNQEYRGLIKGYMLRHKVKPGLTGWAQIHGFRGETDTLDKMEDRITYDLEYLRLWTPLLDIYIIVRTVIVVLTGKNAY